MQPSNSIITIIIILSLAICEVNLTNSLAGARVSPRAHAQCHTSAYKELPQIIIVVSSPKSQILEEEGQDSGVQVLDVAVRVDPMLFTWVGLSIVKRRCKGWNTNSFWQHNKIVETETMY